MSFFLLLNAKEHILKNVGNQTVKLCYVFPILWKSMATVNCLVTNILQNIYGSQCEPCLSAEYHYEKSSVQSLLPFVN